MLYPFPQTGRNNYITSLDMQSSEHSLKITISNLYLGVQQDLHVFTTKKLLKLKSQKIITDCNGNINATFNSKYALSTLAYSYQFIISFSRAIIILYIYITLCVHVRRNRDKGKEIKYKQTFISEGKKCVSGSRDMSHSVCVCVRLCELVCAS